MRSHSQRRRGTVALAVLRNPIRPSHLEVVEGRIASASFNGEVLPVGEDEE
jgi:hypothetical protein